MNKMNVYLDDARGCPKGFILAETTQECIELLRKGNIRILSLDYDLRENDETGYLVVETIVKENLYPEIIYLHTANGEGREKMYGLLQEYKPEHVKLHKGPMCN